MVEPTQREAILGAGAGGPLSAPDPWIQGPGYLNYAGGITVGSASSNKGPGTLNAAAIYINGNLVDLTKYLPFAGGTLTGMLTLALDPVGPFDAVTKRYADNQIVTVNATFANYLPLAGGTISGGLTVNGALMLATDPTASLQAATKQYVDAQTSSSIHIPDAPSDGNTYSRNNGAWTNIIDAATSNVIKILRSIVSGNRPTGRVYGEPYVNFADNQFGVFDSGNNPRDLLGLPVFSTAATYTAGQGMSFQGKPYIALGPVSPGAFNPAQWGQLVPPPAPKAPTRQVFTSGSGTYTAPTTPAPLYIEIEMAGGGGGGGNGNGSTAAGPGGTTTFGASLSCTGGNLTVGAGIATGGDININGSTVGNYANTSDGVTYAAGAPGAGSYFGPGGSSQPNGAGRNAVSPGAGGGGGGTNSPVVGANPGGIGGPSGAYLRKLIANPVASYPYQVGNGGAGAGVGSTGYAGGAGANGIIIVTERYQ